MVSPKRGQYVIAHFGDGDICDALVLKSNEPGYTVIVVGFVNPSSIHKDKHNREIISEASLPHISGAVLKYGYWRFPNELPRGE